MILLVKEYQHLISLLILMCPSSRSQLLQTVKVFNQCLENFKEVNIRICENAHMTHGGRCLVHLTAVRTEVFRKSLLHVEETDSRKCHLSLYSVKGAKTPIVSLPFSR